MLLRLMCLCVAALGLAVPACAQERYGEVYDPEADAAALIDAALVQARDEGKTALFLFGANWCHDSRGLAHRLEDDPRLIDFVDAHYVVTPIDIGMRHRNIDQLQRFGVSAAYGTPTLVIVDSDGALLNSDTVHDWRASDDAGTADIAAYLALHAGVAPPIEGPVAVADIEMAAQGWPSRIQALEAEPDDADLIVYANGLSRSLARLSLGREARSQERDIVSRAEAERLGLEVSEDLTDAVGERLNRIQQDLPERMARELEETAEARADE